MELTDLKKTLDAKLTKPFSARVLLDNLRLIDESSRKTSAYSDPLYIPFYFHLGQCVQAKNVAEFGIRLGLFTSAFLKGCKTVENVLGFQEKAEEYYSPRLGRANVLQNARRHTPVNIYVGTLHDDEFTDLFQRNKWDVVIFNEETGYDKHLAYLDFVWPQMELNGYIVMDYIVRHQPARQAFFDFCKGKNREPVTFDTRYGAGIIER